MDEAESQDPLHIPAPHIPLRPGSELQGRLSKALEGPGHGGVLRGSDPLQVHPLPGVHLRGFVHRGEELDPKGLHRHRWKNYLACHAGIRSQSNEQLTLY